MCYNRNGLLKLKKERGNMNQILVTEKLYITPEIKRKKKMYKIRFCISIFVICMLFSYYIYAEHDKDKSEAVSKDILAEVNSAQISIQNQRQEDEEVVVDPTTKNIINDVCKIDIDDGIEFKINRIEDIRETDDYPGLRVLIGAKYEMVLVPLSIDVTTGDMIIPKEIQYSFSTMFDDYQIQMFTYTLETVLAEKIETILTRGIANTRPRDFYDVYILYKFKGELIDYTILKDALNATTIKRGSEYILVNQGSILETIRKSEELQGFWNRYQKRYKYAEGIQYEDTCKAVESILDRLGKQKNQV